MFNRKVIGFALYDFANSAFVLVFIAYLFPIFFRETLFDDSGQGDYYWGLSISISIVAAIILAPIIGYFTDKGNRKQIFFLLIFIAAVGMFLLSLIPTAQRFLMIAVFVVTNAIFVSSQAIYDSFLPLVAEEKLRAKVSSFAWGLGYLGGVIALAIILVLQRTLGISFQEQFFVVGVYYSIFSLICLYLLPSDTSVQDAEKKGSILSVSRKFFSKEVIFMLVTLYVINDAIDTGISFFSLYSRYTLELSTETIGFLALGAQFLAFPGTYLVGKIAAAKGERKILQITLLVWIIITLGLIFAYSIVHVIIIALLLALVLGSSQALMRSYYSRKIPQDSKGLSFGFYSVVTRGSSLIGPVIFGAVSSSTGSQRIAAITILVPFIAGWWMFKRIK